MTVTGNVLNNDNGGTYITNNGANGMSVNGKVYAKNGTARLYSTAGDLTVGTTAAAIEGNKVQILNNKGGALTLNQGTTIKANEIAQVYNYTSGTGKLTSNATIDATTVSIKNGTGKTGEKLTVQVWTSAVKSLQTVT